MRLANKNNSNKWNVCAVCFAGSRVLGYGYNKSKTEASIIDYANKVDSMYDDSKTELISHCRHAEVDALKKVHYPEKITCIIVVRKTKNGDGAMAKPCNICQQVLKEAGVVTVYFSDIDGNMAEL